MDKDYLPTYMQLDQQDKHFTDELIARYRSTQGNIDRITAQERELRAEKAKICWYQHNVLVTLRERGVDIDAPKRGE